MKPQSVLTLLAAACLLYLPVALGAGTDAATGDNPSAYAALRSLQSELGANSLQHIVEVTGQEGVPQPFLWRITLADAANSTLREVDVAGGKIVSQRTVARTERPMAGAPISLKDLNLDSSGAFSTADTQARKVRLSFDALNYVLQADATTGKPVWTLQLLNADGDVLGTLAISASDAVVINATGKLAAIPTPATAPPTTTVTVQPTAPAGAPPTGPGVPPAEPSLAATTTTTTTTTTEEQERANGGFFERSGRTLDKTGKTVERSLRRAGSSIEHFFTGKSDADKDE